MHMFSIVAGFSIGIFLILNILVQVLECRKSKACKKAYTVENGSLDFSIYLCIYLFIYLFIYL